MFEEKLIEYCKYSDTKQIPTEYIDRPPTQDRKVGITLLFQNRVDNDTQDQQESIAKKNLR